MTRSFLGRLLVLRSLSLFVFVFVALVLFSSLLVVYSFHSHRATSHRSTVAVAYSSIHDIAMPAGTDGLRPRHQFTSYEEYLQLQLNKTLNARLRRVWSTVDWRRKINVFSPIFRWHLDQGLVQPRHKVLCIGARMGQEVVAFKEVGVVDAVGIDLVPAPPLVIQGDIHQQPFPDNTFDMEFSNVFDHALFPQRFVSEIERTLKPSGVAVLHVALHTRSDKFSVYDLLSVDTLLDLFHHSDVVHIRGVDAFGLDTEVVMRKKYINTSRSHIFSGTTTSSYTCSASKIKSALVNLAEPLILTEPKKPWITLKKNLKSVKYLPTITDIENHRRYIYVDIGARDYQSSIGCWFQKAYPKQGHNFTIYAIEADGRFRHSYANHAEVNFMPYAAWIRNESLMFGSEIFEGSVAENRSSAGVGMGRIQSLENRLPNREQEFVKVQGLDIAEWIQSVASEGDFLVVKMDVEGAEFDLLARLRETRVICLVDELFLECHYNRWQRCCAERTTKYNRTYEDCLAMFQSLRRDGVLVHQWW